MNTKLMGLAVTGLALASTGCKLTDKLKDALDGENDSYCEAACDWAVACAADGSALSEDELMEACIAETEAQDPDCGGAEDALSIDEAVILNECTADQIAQDCSALLGSEDELMEACIAETEAQDPDCGGAEDALSIDQAVILNECTADQIAQDCAALTGEEDEIVKGTPPVATCMIAYGQGTDALVSAVSDLPGSVTELNDIQAYKTYNVARNAVLADGAEICERFEETMCGYMTECLVEKGGIDVGADIEQATTDACIESVFGNITDSCISEGRYDSVIPVDYNPARWGAEECMDDWDETAASSSACDIFTSVPSAKCALAFTSTDQVETVFNGIISFAGDYGDFF